jgi:UDP-N-acetylglucosamine diphosphorylase/glucosamine-1-phosphate N-acetyltransferase
MDPDKNRVAAVILAAGMGTRMKSSKAKVLHEIGGRPMITYVVQTAQRIAGDNIVLVVGHQADTVKSVVSQNADVAYALQAEQLGTGHAVRCALPQIPSGTKEVLILYGDVPLLRAETIKMLVHEHRTNKNHVTVLAVEMADPTGYGRILCDAKGRFCKIVEQADASAEQKKIKLINTGIYCVQKHFLTKALSQIKADNNQKEFYLTDIIGLGYAGAKKIGFVVGQESDETTGVNTLDDLAQVESILNKYQKQGNRK